MELPATGPWIPGQQLYGAMIPRPEYEYELHRDELAKQRVQFKKFQKQVLAKLDGEESSAEKKMLDFNASTTAHLGYEVVPHLTSDENGQEPQIDSNHNDIYCETSQSRLSVLLSDNESVDSSGGDGGRIVLETDGDGTFSVSYSQEDAMEDDGEEAGFEVVACGRLLTIFSEDDEHSESDDSSNTTDDDTSSYGDEVSQSAESQSDDLEDFFSHSSEEEEDIVETKINDEDEALRNGSPSQLDLQNPSTSTETDVESESHQDKMVLLKIALPQNSTMNSGILKDRNAHGIADEREETHSNDIFADNIEEPSSAARSSPTGGALQEATKSTTMYV